MVKFKLLTGDLNWAVYGGKFISQKLNNGDFDYWLVIEVLNWQEATGETNQGTYNVSISAVAPSKVPETEMKRAFESCGNETTDATPSSETKVEVLHQYGIYASLYNQNGNNLRKLLQEAKQEAQKINMLFGFYMDGPENKIGSTGWDLIKGDLNAALKRLA